jgi:hypothetical protein
MNLNLRVAVGEKPSLVGHNPRAQQLLKGPITPMLLRMAWPDVLVMLRKRQRGSSKRGLYRRSARMLLLARRSCFPASC